jgi:O-antigen/teichoic acid export membrane protein
MDLTAKLGSRFKAAFAAKIIGVVAGGILTIVLARLLNPSSYGILFLAISIFSVAKLFSAFGLAKSASRYIAEFKETDPSQIPHILRFAFGLNLLTISVVVMFFILGRHLIANFVGEPGLSPFLLLGSGFIVFSTIEVFIRQTLQGFEKIKAASTVSVINKTSRLGLAIGFVLLGYEAIGALTGYIVAYGFVVIIGGVYLFQELYRQFEPSSVESGLRRKIAEYSLPIAVTQSAHTIDHHLDKILVGIFLSPVSVAYYTLGKQVVQFIEAPISALGFTLSPTYGSQKAQGNSRTAARVYETALSHGLLVYIPAAAGVMILAEPGIRLVFGTEYLGAVPVLQILSVFAVLQSITKLTSHGLDYLGRARERSIAKIITAVLNVALNIILIPAIGVVGAALATVVTFALYTFFNVFIMNLELDFRILWILKQVGYSILITILMSFVVLLFVGYIDGIVSLLAIVALGVTIWVISVIGLGLIDLNRISSALFYR